MLLRFVGKVANFYVEPFCYSAKKVITHIDPPCFNVAQVRLSRADHEREFFLARVLGPLAVLARVLLASLCVLELP